MTATRAPLHDDLEPGSGLSPANLDKFALIAAGGLIGFAVVLWIAANWAAISEATRLTVAAAIVVGSGVVAVSVPRLIIPAAIVGLFATGGLLALIGMIYQTGADNWTLFALWALLGIAWGLAARHDAVWVPWTAVACTALALYAHSGRPNMTLGIDAVSGVPTLTAWTIGLLIAGMFSPAAGLDPVLGRTRWAYRFALTLAVVAIAAGVTSTLPWSFGRTHGGINVYALLGTLMLVGMTFAVSRLRPLELPLLVLTGFALYAVLLGYVWQVSVGVQGRFFVLIFLTLSTGLAFIFIGALKKLASAAAAKAASGDDINGTARAVVDWAQSWPVMVATNLTGLVGAIAALLFLAALTSLHPIGLLLGIVVLAAALTFSGVSFEVVSSSLLIAVLIGIAALLHFDSKVQYGGLIFALITTASAVFTPSRRLTTLLGNATAIALAFGLQGWRPGPPFLAADITIPAVLAALAIGGVMQARGLQTTNRSERSERGPIQPQDDELGRLEAFVTGFAALVLLIAIVQAGSTYLSPAFMGGSGRATRHTPVLSLVPDVAKLASVGMVIVAASIAIAARRLPLTPSAMAATLVLAALAFAYPPLGCVTLVGAAAWAGGHRVVAVTAAITVLWITGAFYYATGLPLREKAAYLAGLGAILFVAPLVGLVVPGIGPNVRSTGPAASTPSGAIGTTRNPKLTVIAGIAATLLLAGGAVALNEHTLRTGRTIYLPLMPVDPRSLTQGDFMALNFDVRPWDGRRSGGQSWLAAEATIDGRNVAKFTGRTVVSQPPYPREADRTIIRLAYRKGRYVPGTDALFFEEGKERPFEVKARYGIFAVDSHGNARLTGLADQDFQKIR
jgi:uncharacterized membrane-anchored protein/uncharacterized membrane protein